MTTLRTPTFKGKKAMTILSWLALAFVLLKSALSISFSSAFIYGPVETGLIEEILYAIVPCMLIALYITQYYGKRQAFFLLPIAFVLLAFGSIRYIVFERLIHSVRMTYYMDWVYLVSAILWIEVALVTLMKRYNRTSIIMAVLGGLASETWVVIQIGISLIWHTHSYWHDIMGMVSVFGNLCLYAALVIFALMAVTKVSAEEEELKTLQAQLASGKITEEEYQAKRADIIRRL